MKLCSGCFEKYDERLSMCPFCGYEEGDEKESNSYLDVGTMLNNKYVIGAAIGNGGFGVTYYAWDINLQQKLAIKEYLPSEFSTRMQGKLDIIVFKGEKEEQFNVGLEKFVGEANKLVEFRDTEGVVRIQESFFEFGTAYIVMEYLDGETLSKYLSENPMNSSEKTISMMMPIIQSLKQIHAKGILHRDISPDNIIITKEGKAKLIDFGASRHETATKTRSMSVITKAGYSPEEQYRNSGDQGAYTDVYALAATMYHMITGVKPPISIERNAYYKEKKKDLLEPILNYNKEISENEEIAIANALNIKIEQRTESMDIFEKELTSDTPIKRRDGSIKATDLLTWPLWLKISVPSFATCLMTLILLFSFGIIGFNANLETELVVASGLTRVPLIVSDEIEEATLKLESASLNYQIVGKSYSEHIPANYILSQDLTAGMLINTNSIVSVLISAGSEESLTFKDANGMYTLADVQFQEVETATTILETQEMSVIIVEEYNDTVASGLVISQYPEAGTLLLPGEEITLTVSKGGEGFTLPSFVDMTEDEARATLSQLGLVVSVEYNNESDLPDGTVISQDIKDGTIVMLGSTVSLVVSSYKDLEDIPDVVGLTQSEATKILESLGYVVQVNVLDSTQINFKVLSQSPQSGLSAEIGSTVIINMLGDDVVKETATPTATATPTPTPTPTATPTPTPTVTATPTPTFTLSFNANGGSVSTSSKTVTVNSSYGTLPTPTRDYYTFDGWYTSSSGGTKVTSTTTNSTTSNVTLYAHWTENATSGWVLASSVPSDAKIVETKYSYDSTSYTTSSSSSLSGWKLYDTTSEWSDYGSWSSWSTSKYTSSDSRKVETQSVSTLSGYNMVAYNTLSTSGSRQYRNFSVNGAYSTYGLSSTYGEFSYSTTVSTSVLNSATTVSSGSYTSACTYDGYNKSSTTGYILTYGSKTYVFFIGSKNYTTTTQYRYCDRTEIYTYYYSKVESLEQTSYPSGSDVSNIKEYVKYQAK